MPTYQDALSAEPSEFLTYAAEMTAAAADLATQQTDYSAKVAEINGHWQDNANQAFNGEVGNVNAHLTEVISAITATAGSLASAGTQMLAECTILKAADAALKATGFNVQPAPLVQLGPAQRTAIAMAGPFGGFLEAVLQAQAMAGTLGLQSLTSLVNAADATAGAALSQAAELLKPLEDKTGGTGKDLESHATAEDHSAGAAEEATEPSEEEQREEATEEEEAPTEPEAEQQQEPTSPSGQQPTMPETPSMEDLAQPEMPELDSPWDAAELTDPEDIAGGLASGAGLGADGGGGGLGGALGSGGLATGAGSVPQGGMGTGAMLGAPTGAAGAGAAGTGKGAGGGMMGAGGGRGAGGRSDDEVTRESFLIEDPDEDVWGVAKAADDQYE
jgi:uncharacterized protein YukE